MINNKRERGATLTELVFAMGMLSLIAYIFLEAFVPGLRLFGRINKRSEFLQKGAIVMEKIHHDLSMIFPLSLTLLRYEDKDTPVKSVAFLRLNKSAPYDFDTNAAKPESGYTIYCFNKEKNKLLKKFLPVDSAISANTPMTKPELEAACGNGAGIKDLEVNDVVFFNINPIPEYGNPTAFKISLTLDSEESKRNGKGAVELATSVSVSNIDR